jgi:1-deoxy-D-xylulose-5-phosphate reductoisomerase
MRNLVILGATGSVGTSARRVAASLPDRVRVVGMSAHANTDGLAKAGAEFPMATTVLSSGEDGAERLIDLATMPGADLVLVAIVGTGGLRPALAAIEAGKDLAVASKEILVMAGEVVMRAARERGVRVLPVDSEHNAIFQCLDGRDPASVRRLVLTCSGGPFRNASPSEIASATPETALRHPTWNMGPKISIDSATLFNKGLEMIEAKWLFGVPMDRIDVVVHPQSIIHSMVEFVDASVIAQLSHSDMGFPIQYALTWPERVPGALKPMDFPALGRLEFEAPRTDVFPALDLARAAGKACGTAPAVLNAANEVAVEAFLENRIPFPAIWEVVARTLEATPPKAGPSLADILEADTAARSLANSIASSP